MPLFPFRVSKFSSSFLFLFLFFGDRNPILDSVGFAVLYFTRYEKCMNKKHLVERNSYMAFFAAFLPLLIRCALLAPTTPPSLPSFPPPPLLAPSCLSKPPPSPLMSPKRTISRPELVGARPRARGARGAIATQETSTFTARVAINGVSLCACSGSSRRRRQEQNLGLHSRVFLSRRGDPTTLHVKYKNEASELRAQLRAAALACRCLMQRAPPCSTLQTCT